RIVFVTPVGKSGRVDIIPEKEDYYISGSTRQVTRQPAGYWVILNVQFPSVTDKKNAMGYRRGLCARQSAELHEQREKDAKTVHSCSGYKNRPGMGTSA